MSHLKFTFTVFLIVNLLRMGGGVMAQDRISNTNGFGDYTGGDVFQNVIINNTNNEPLLYTPNSEHQVNNNGNLAANFVGGANCEISDVNEIPAAYNILYGNLSTINSSIATIVTGKANTSEQVSSSAAIGARNSLIGSANTGTEEDDLSKMFAIGQENSLEEVDPGFAIGYNNFVDGGRLDADNLYAIGSRLLNFNSNSMVLGFGSEGDRLDGSGPRSITLGTYNENTGAPYQTLNVRPPSVDNSFNAPLVGIGTNRPNAKLNIVNRGATGGESSSDGVAFRIEELRDSNGNIERFSVRNDGAASFNLPARPGRPRAPYQFEKSKLSPFPEGSDGRANIVQNYDAFPNFKNVGPNPPGTDNGEAKWLALGERPPASSTSNNDQVAYGLANVWQNNAANFVLLDQDPATSGQSDEKDLAITFQDVWNQGEPLTNPGNAGNRIRFLFRNFRDIDDNNSTFELMSLEPTGEVAVGDFSSTTKNPEARLHVDVDNTNQSDTSILVTDGNQKKTFIVRNDGVVGINRTSIANTGVDLTVGGDAEKSGSNTWLSTSDKRLKKNIKPFEDGLKTLMDINPVWYQYNGKQELPTEGKHVGIIAQEMKEIAPYMVIENDNGYYSYDANALWYILVNAVQEQQKVIKEEKQQRKEKIEQLEDRIADLESKMKGNHGSGDAAPQVKPENQKTVQLNNENIDEPILYQNVPNPFQDETVIKYYLPEDSRNSELLIASAREGTVLKRISLEQSGKGQVNLQTDNLKTGTYTYSLLVNGKQVESRKMLIKP